MDRILYILTGPTAVGKTVLSLKWAEKLNAEIISCDSLLVYRGMDVGTAKPSLEERKQIPHHGIDIVPVSQKFSIREYQDMAVEKVADIQKRGKAVLVVGGSGFYLNVFLKKGVDLLTIPSEIAEKVSALYREKGREGLVKCLMELNSKEEVERLDLCNPRRLSKALERCLVSGKSLGEIKADFVRQSGPFERYIREVCFLSRSPESLRRRIEERVDQMLKRGLIEEVSQLCGEGLLENPSAVGSVGYREVVQWQGGSLLELQKAIVQRTVRLVRKQRTWFRNQLKTELLREASLNHFFGDALCSMEGREDLKLFHGIM